jgi:hypothetical protein
MKPNRSDIRKLKVRCSISALRSTTPSKSPRKSRSEIPGQSCRALPSNATGRRRPDLSMRSIH